MDPEIYEKALRIIWPELPILLGSEWDFCRPDLEKILETWLLASEEERGRLPEDLARVIGRYPAAYTKFTSTLGIILIEQVTPKSRGIIPAFEQFERATSAASTVEARITEIPPPDLILQITTKDRQLNYELLFSNARYRAITGPKLDSEPERYRHELFREIEQLAGNKSQDSDYHSDQLNRIGQDLFQNLFPMELRREYRAFRDRVRTIMIRTDEPWIPWEMIKPYDDEGGPVVDDPYLCLKFELSRWLLGAREPVQRLAIKSLACVVPTDSRLPQSISERDELLSMAQACGIEDFSLLDPTYSAVTTLLSSNKCVKLWHFACHGDFDQENPATSSLRLQDGSRLRPRDMNGPPKTHLKADRPLVFLNACRSGEVGQALTGLGGWAKTLIEDCEAGAMLAPMWKVNDQLARTYAKAFYEVIQKTPSCTLAHAVQQARIQARDMAPNDPSWLSYSLYAHPDARIVLGDG